MSMTCPKCQGAMRQYERNGVTVDQCSECRGIFLDRGELERLIDAEATWHAGSTAAPAAAPAAPYPAAPPPGYDRRRGYDSDEYPQYGHSGHRPRKRKSFLSELFD